MLLNKNSDQNQNSSNSASNADIGGVRPNVRIMPGAKKSAGGTFFGMFLGLVIGIVAAAGIVIMINKTPMPFDSEQAQQKQQEIATANQLVKKAENGELLELPNKPGDKIPEKRFQFYDILPGKQQAMPHDKNAVQMDGLATLPDRSDDFVDANGSNNANSTESAELFDDIINNQNNSKKNEQNLVENNSQDVEKPQTENPEQAKETKKSESSKVGKILIQAGSFSRSQEADNQKAKLAMLGFESYIQQVMVQDKTFYRVRIAANDEKEANSIQQELTAANIKSTMIK